MVRENGITQCRMRKSGEHGHLYTAMTSPASGPIIVKPRIRSPFASINAFMSPRVSSIVRVLSTAVMGICATRTAIPAPLRFGFREAHCAQPEDR